jgi:predicted ATPase
LKKFVYDRDLLLVLDNFEHLINAAPLVTELLNASPHLKVLVTSRTLLHVYGEHLHPVRPLILPPQAGETQLESIAQSEAVQLFIERTRAMRANFTLTSDNFRSVSEICARLDGLPLAIELRSARSSNFPQAMLSQWAEAGGQTRLQTLADGQRDLPARHQTLRNAIAWSYQLLDEAEKKVFRRAGVLVGDWTLEAAENVIGPSMLEKDTESMPSPQSPPIARNLNSLVDNHLLESFELDGEIRFSMLETIVSMPWSS